MIVTSVKISKHIFDLRKNSENIFLAYINRLLLMIAEKFLQNSFFFCFIFLCDRTERTSRNWCRQTVTMDQNAPYNIYSKIFRHLHKKQVSSSVYRTNRLCEFSIWLKSVINLQSQLQTEDNFKPSFFLHIL